jgi:protein tyrosine phosphatase (PTP) superfamily phosphohydrolase (DUF442 family)
MVRILRTLVVVAVLSVFLLFAGIRFAWSQALGQTVNNPAGVPNWGRVTDMLYRGGQPSTVGFKALQQMGVAIIVNFRDEPEETFSERREVESMGIKYVNIPWSGSDQPSSWQVVQFLDLVRANPQAKIFVHCKRGADRTGVMIAAYRIAVERKTVTDADSEMNRFHYDRFWLPHLQRYVNNLPQLLDDSPLFSAYALPPSALPANDVVPTDIVAAPRSMSAESPTLIQ